MIGLGVVYVFAGLFFVGYALHVGRGPRGPRRVATAGFLALVAVSFLFGGALGDLANGVLVLALVGLAIFGIGVGAREDRALETEAAVRADRAGRQGDRLFWLALIVPSAALLGALTLKGFRIAGQPLVDPKQASVIALALGVVVALAVALPVLRARPAEPVQAGAELARAIGWAILLPQMLAALGAVFAQAGVGHAVADLTTDVIPAGDRLAAVAAYTVGMAVFTLVMGNAFAAFPVMTAGVGLPLIVRRLHGDPAIMGSLGMLSGFCGALLTPLAANFNIVPVALLELPDRWAVIRVQAPTALVLLAVNTGLMYALVFRF